MTRPPNAETKRCGCRPHDLHGLDGINFLMADVRDGIGPYLSIHLSGLRDWQAGPIGVAIAISNLAAAVCQVPGELLVDTSRAKRLLITAAALIVGLGCLSMCSTRKVSLCMRRRPGSGRRWR